MDWLDILAPRLVNDLGAVDLRRCALASRVVRLSVSSFLNVVVVILDNEPSMAWPGFAQEACDALAAADLVGLEAYTHAPNDIGGWAVPWRPGFQLPRCFEWCAAPWLIACSSLAMLDDVQTSLWGVLALEQSMDENSCRTLLLSRLVALGAPWAPLQSPPPASLELPSLRRIWANAGAAMSSAWSWGRPVPELLIQGSFAAGSRVDIDGVLLLRIDGTTPEDLAAVDGLAPRLLELEIAPTDFDCMEDVYLDHESPTDTEEEPPTMHVAPDPARFLRLQRLQACLDKQSFVILGTFLHQLPALRRLGTVHLQRSEIAARMAGLPTGLEECVFALSCEGLAASVSEDPFGLEHSLREACQHLPRLQCSHVHLCIVDEGGLQGDSERSLRTALGGLSSDFPLRVSVQSPAAESTPLSRLVV